MTTYHLRDQSGVEVFTGTITPAPGGGSQPTTREQISGNSVSIADSASGDLTWDTKLSGDSLLDLTAPANPLIIAAGVYAVTFVGGYAEPGTNGGLIMLSVGIDVDDPGGNALTTTAVSVPVAALIQEPTVVVTLVWYSNAGGRLNANVFNRDGATRTFILTAAIQRLSA
jgi:hypothetical protein